jgi:hypothetical protein
MLGLSILQELRLIRFENPLHSHPFDCPLLISFRHLSLLGAQ